MTKCGQSTTRLERKQRAERWSKASAAIRAS